MSGHSARAALAAALVLTIACGDDPKPSLAAQISGVSKQSCDRDFRCEASASRSKHGTANACTLTVASNVATYLEQQDAACRKAFIAVLQCEAKAPCGDTTGRCAKALLRVDDTCLSGASDEPPPSGTTTPRAPSSGGAATCEECLVESCSSEVEGCFGKAACEDYVDCTADCDDSACASECASDSPEGARAFQPLGRCLTSKCASSCGDT